MVAFEVLLAIGLMVVLIGLGVPVFASLGLGVVLLIRFTDVVPMVFVGDSMFIQLRTFVLLAIPLFILTGDIIVESDLSTELMEFADAVVGGFRSGVGSATVMGCGLFASITGSNASDAAAITRITYDDLKSFGYPGAYSGALIASGASTGILIPPSIVYIVAGVILGISASDLFLAAFIPGLMILFGVMATNIVVNRRRGYESGHEFLGPIGMAKAAWEAKLALSMPFIILGGIYSGIFTPTESAAVAVMVVIVFAMPKGQLKLSDFPGMFERSAAINGTIAPIIAVALMLGEMLAIYRIPSQIVDVLLGTAQGKIQIILILVLIFVAGGAIMETAPNLVILGPLLFPTAQEIGLHPVHYTVLMVTTLGLGFITPPFGLNLFVVAGMTDEPVYDVAKAAMPFIVVLLAITLIISFFPELYMWVLLS